MQEHIMHITGCRVFPRPQPRPECPLFAYEATEIDFLPYEVHATRHSQQPVLKKALKGPCSVL
jgi:hypothetical protein